MQQRPKSNLIMANKNTVENGVPLENLNQRGDFNDPKPARKRSSVKWILIFLLIVITIAALGFAIHATLDGEITSNDNVIIPCVM